MGFFIKSEKGRIMVTLTEIKQQYPQWQLRYSIYRYLNPNANSKPWAFSIWVSRNLRRYEKATGVTQSTVISSDKTQTAFNEWLLQNAEEVAK